MADSQDGTIKVSFVPGRAPGEHGEAAYTLYDSPLAKTLANFLNIPDSGSAVKFRVNNNDIWARRTREPNQIVFTRSAPGESKPPKEEPKAPKEEPKAPEAKPAQATQQPTAPETAAETPPETATPAAKEAISHLSFLKSLIS